MYNKVELACDLFLSNRQEWSLHLQVVCRCAFFVPTLSAEHCTISGLPEIPCLWPTCLDREEEWYAGWCELDCHWKLQANGHPVKNLGHLNYFFLAFSSSFFCYLKFPRTAPELTRLSPLQNGYCILLWLPYSKGTAFQKSWRRCGSATAHLENLVQLK